MGIDRNVLTAFVKEVVDLQSSTKTAASRTMKDAKKVLLAIRGVQKRHVSGRSQSPRNYLKLLKSLRGKPGVTDDLIKEVKLEKSLRGDLSSVNFARSNYDRALSKIHAKRKWSGRHAAREGETFLPSTGRAGTTLGSGDKEHIWRGMALPTTPLDSSIGANTAFFTRHPDIAATYASAKNTKAVSRPDNRLFRYKRPAASVEGASLDPTKIKSLDDLSGIDTGGIPKSEILSPHKRRSFELVKRDYGVNPTYETLSRIDAQGLKELGVPVEYAVRRARGPKGEVGYALKQVT